MKNISAVPGMTFDTNVRPQDDFHQWVNGVWFRDNPIPDDKPIWGSFAVLCEEGTKKLNDIFTELAVRKGELTANEQKVRDFYLSGMRNDANTQTGFSDLYVGLDMIGTIQNTKDLVSVIAWMHRRGIGVFWDIGVMPDKKDSGTYALYLVQSGLGLQDREYYLSESPNHVQIREKYAKHILRMFCLGGFTGTDAESVPSIIGIETALAGASMSRAELRDEGKTYHKKTQSELSLLAPTVHWDTYFSSLGLRDVNDVIVGQPEFFKEASGLIQGLSLEEMRVYLVWHLLSSSAPYLGESFAEENFSFYGKVLSGALKIPERWKRVTEKVSQALGEIVGQLYIERHFSPNAKTMVNDMVDAGIEVFRDHIVAADWMDEETRRTALLKLSKTGRKLGFPDTWRDYGELHVFPGDYLGNVFRANEFEWRRMADRLGKGVDRTEWVMTPQTANACYDPMLLEVTFPAAVMQPPLFDEYACVAMNFGSIVAVILHEITHGCDDQGRKYDEYGNLRDWWTAASTLRFMECASVLENEWNLEGLVFNDSNNPGTIEVLHVNGKLTLGENIADLGGVSMAFEAMQKYFTKHGRPVKMEGGLTPEQHFFVGWARTWCMHACDEFRRMMLLRDVHAPAKLRCNATLSHLSEFHEAFGIQEGDKMYRSPERRAKVW